MGKPRARQEGMHPPDRKSDRTSVTAAKLAFFDRLTVEPDLTHLDCRIAWRLLHYTHGVTGIYWPSYQRLAADAHCDKRSAIRSVKRLIAEGWFDIVQEGRGKSNLYRPNLAKVGVVESPPEENKLESSGVAESPRGDRGTPAEVTQEHLESFKPLNHPLKAGASSASPLESGYARTGSKAGDLQLRVFGQFAGGQAKQDRRDREDDEAMAENLGVEVELVIELREVMAIAQVGWSVAKCVAVDTGMRRETADMDGAERVDHMIQRYREMAEEASKAAGGGGSTTEAAPDVTTATAAMGGA